MSGFSSLNTALSALRYNRVAMDVAAGNVANVGTEGYARRRVQAETVGAPAQVAMWSRYEGSGDGVRVGGLQRMVDPFLDARARIEHGNQAYLDVRASVLERIESGIGEPGDNGVAAAMADFRQGWQDLANNPGNEAARSQVLARANTLSDAINIQARNITTEAADQRVRLNGLVSEVNTLAGDLAATNESIAAARLNGTDAGGLLDQRDQLALRLAELTGATITPGPEGNLDVSLGGQSLVSGQTAHRLTIATGVTATGAADGNPVTFAIVDADGVSTPIAAGVGGGRGGEIGAVTDLLSTTLPDYLDGLNGVATTLATDVNALHADGYGLDGVGGRAFFEFGDATNPALSLTVAITDRRQIAASALASTTPGEGNLDGGNAAALSGTTAEAEGVYQRLVNGFGTEVASVRRLAANQQVLTNQVDGSREQLSGINLDEEMLSMLAHQRAYEAAARVITTVDSVLDTLINRTGLLR